MTKNTNDHYLLFPSLIAVLCIFCAIAGFCAGEMIKSQFDPKQSETTAYQNLDRMIDRADAVIDNLRAELDRDRKIYVPKPLASKVSTIEAKFEKLSWQIEFIDDLTRLRNGQRPTGKIPGMTLPNPNGSPVGSVAPN